MATIQENLEKQIYNQISPIIKAYNEPIIQASKAVAEASKDYNNYLNVNREQLLVVSKSIASVADTYKTIYNEPIINASQEISSYFKANQEMISNLSRKFKEVYSEPLMELSTQINNFFERNNIKIANLMENINNIIKIPSIKDIYSDIDFDKISINNNGTIEYEGAVFEKETIEETTKELIEDVNSKNYININTILKKLIISFIFCFAILCFPQEILQWFMLALSTGFADYFGTKMIEHIIGIFKKRYPVTANKNITYFDTHCAMVGLEQLQVRKQPDKKQPIIGYLYYLQLVNIIQTKPYWSKIEYKDEENKIYISGWVSTRGLKKFNTLTSQFEDIQKMS